jgi:hypothetical protein
MPRLDERATFTRFSVLCYRMAGRDERAKGSGDQAEEDEGGRVEESNGGSLELLPVEFFGARQAAVRFLETAIALTFFVEFPIVFVIAHGVKIAALISFATIHQ